MKNGEKPSRRISKPGISADKNAVFWVCLKMRYLKMTIFRWKMMINQWLWAAFQTNIDKHRQTHRPHFRDSYGCSSLQVWEEDMFFDPWSMAKNCTTKTPRFFWAPNVWPRCPRNILMVIAGKEFTLPLGYLSEYGCFGPIAIVVCNTRPIASGSLSVLSVFYNVPYPKGHIIVWCTKPPIKFVPMWS